jgi:hypothetical protein
MRTAFRQFHEASVVPPLCAEWSCYTPLQVAAALNNGYCCHDARAPEKTYLPRLYDTVVTVQGITFSARGGNLRMKSRLYNNTRLPTAP